MSELDEPAALPATDAVVARLVAGHREFLSFLQGRLRDKAQAEEVLQAAFVRTLERGGSIRDDEDAKAWFYRLLRNALIDAHRRGTTEGRALEQHGHETAQEVPSPDELHDAVCKCMHTLLPTLKPEYAEVLRRVDLEEQSVSQVAEALGITANNATVRLHRARQALRKQLVVSCGTCSSHGCLECTCGEPGGGCA